eukprot:5236880-Lingulodinium_polyedra.AAC.1
MVQQTRNDGRGVNPDGARDGDPALAGGRSEHLRALTRRLGPLKEGWPNPDAAVGHGPEARERVDERDR